ncbi:hypothetical protein QWJ26_00715 [Streptomyces sp. CSDS2]|uniref:hypothetical protein n=1 Tax=Streptomyces sp. CSDS2 TaxID=3055051 RepID=UPI0025B20DD6|nr:hypothetical protein [Streptomyces sp. CSDS2]MDN3258354.1 hypothetical protein [Streptomyces sp. CSDS2]
MSSFTRPPEWQQPADRHTRLSDPVLTVRQLSRFEFSLKHVVRIDHALVFATPKGGYDAYLPPHRPTRGEIVAHRYTAVYEVDMGVHPFTGTFTLPSDNDAFEFTAEVDFSWQVLDPAGFVRSGHRDVPGLLVGTLQQAARPVSRRFPITDSATAERELLTALAPLGTLGSDAGLQVTWTLRLRRDQADIEHQRRLQAIDHSAAEQVRVAQRGVEVDAELDRRAREQDRLQIERAMVYGRQHQELALQQQHWQQEQVMLRDAQQHQLAVQQAQHALAMQQYEAQKVAFYQWHLQQGGVQAWALHLAEHPEDTGLVMTAMRDDQLRMIQAQMELVKELLAGDNAEKFELEGPKQLALRTVTDILNQRLPGVAQNPPLIPPGPDPRSAPAPGEITEGGTEPLAPDSGGDGAEAVAEDRTPPGGQRPAPEAPHTAPPAPYTPPYAPPPTPYAATPPFTGAPAAATAPQAPAPSPHSPYPTQPGGFYPPPMPAAPPAQPSGWQPPPGYGTVPTAPPQPPAAPPVVPPPPRHPPAAGTPEQPPGSSPADAGPRAGTPDGEGGAGG